MTRLLVSVRDVAEALLAAEHGADLVDCKEPSAGALGALPVETIAAVVRAVRSRFPGRTLSATVGDFAPDAVGPVLERVAAVAATGVDYVKVGVAPGAFALLDALRKADTNGNGLIELSELVGHVQSVVPRIAAGIGSADPQTARFGSHGEDFVVARRLP